MATRVSPSAISLILLLMATTSVLIMLSLNQINYIVHGDLYNFNLKFSYQWAMPYWILSGIIFGLSWTNIVLSIIFTIHVQRKSRRTTRPTLRTEADNAADMKQGLVPAAEAHSEVQVQSMTERALEVPEASVHSRLEALQKTQQDGTSQSPRAPDDEEQDE